jgi:hypothetical protein
MLKTLGEPKRLGSKIGQVFHLSEESGSGLNRMLSSPVASSQHRRPQMRRAIEAFDNASGEEFPAPNGAVISETCAVTTYRHHAFIPCLTLGEHGRDVSTVMLDRECLYSSKLGRMNRRQIFRVSIMSHDQLFPWNFVHGK